MKIQKKFIKSKKFKPPSRRAMYRISSCDGKYYAIKLFGYRGDKRYIGTDDVLYSANNSHRNDWKCWWNSRAVLENFLKAKGYTYE